MLEQNGDPKFEIQIRFIRIKTNWLLATFNAQCVAVPSDDQSI